MRLNELNFHTKFVIGLSVVLAIANAIIMDGHPVAWVPVLVWAFGNFWGAMSQIHKND